MKKVLIAIAIIYLSIGLLLGFNNFNDQFRSKTYRPADQCVPYIPRFTPGSNPIELPNTGPVCHSRSLSSEEIVSAVFSSIPSAAFIIVAWGPLYIPISLAWWNYGRYERAKAGYPPKQSPQINADLAYSRNEGAVYSDSHTGNYAGICNSPKMVELKNNIISMGNFSVTCKDTKTAWAILVTLDGNNSRYWCADSQGNTASWKEKSANLAIDTSCLGN